MFKKISAIVFSVIALCMLTLPLLTINLREGKISEAENRRLASFPNLYEEDGAINKNILSDFEGWVNDNIGFRSKLVLQNAKIQYNVFGVLANNSDMYLGPHGELNYATDSMLVDYQHQNLKTDEELANIAKSFQWYADYIEDQGIQYYYYQCWDKHSIYPEYFPQSVKQNGDISKTDQIVSTLVNDTTIDVISPKEELIQGKEQYATYSVWGDATHWSERGAYIGYLKLMNEINSRNDNKYKVLSEDDYIISNVDKGSTLFGGIHQVDIEETFDIKDPQAYKSDEAPLYVCEWGTNYRNILYNDSVDNQDTLMILGDSYFDSFLYDDLGESFHRVVLIWGGNDIHIQELIDTYHPAIIISENAERCERTRTVYETYARLSGEVE